MTHELETIYKPLYLHDAVTGIRFRWERFAMCNYQNRSFRQSKDLQKNYFWFPSKNAAGIAVRSNNQTKEKKIVEIQLVMMTLTIYAPASESVQTKTFVLFLYLTKCESNIDQAVQQRKIVSS